MTLNSLAARYRKKLGGDVFKVKTKVVDVMLEVNTGYDDNQRFNPTL